MSEGRARVLLVDDDPSILVTAEAILAEVHDVDTARDGSRALTLLRVREYDVVCTDYVMPGMDGIALLQQASALQTSFAGVLVTGSAEHAAAGDIRRYYTLIKPYEPHLLLDIVARAARHAERLRDRRATGRRVSPPDDAGRGRT